MTNIAHQLGYFETVAGVDLFFDSAARIESVTAAQVADVARAMLPTTNRTVGWFDPVPVSPVADREAP